MTLAFWTASAMVMLSFGFVLGWAARWAIVDLERHEEDVDVEGDVLPFPERPGA